MTKDEKLNKVMNHLENMADDVLEIYKRELSSMPLYIQTIIVTKARIVILSTIKEICSEVYNEEDLDILLAFYSSDTGKKAFTISEKIASPEYTQKLEQRMIEEIKSAIELLTATPIGEPQ
jgi:hypothetical protein